MVIKKKNPQNRLSGSRKLKLKTHSGPSLPDKYPNIDMMMAEALTASSQSKMKANQILPIVQLSAQRSIDNCHRMYEKDKYWLMRAIRICAANKLPMPDWVAKAYGEAYDTVDNAESKSWNEVFGNPYPKGKQLAAERRRKALERSVWEDITKLRRETGRSLEDLFSDIGKKYNLSESQTKKYYYEAKDYIEK